MSALVNIPRTVNDPTYRYKMHCLKTQVEGRGNGVRTLILNLADVAKEIQRMPSDIIKFMAIELGSLSKCDEVNVKFLVNGSHATDTIQTLLDKFIEKFVLCPKCHLPETHLSVKPKKELIYRSCLACGEKSLIDMSHKLCNIILKTYREQKKKAGNKKSEPKEEQTPASPVVKVVDDNRGELDHYLKVKGAFEVDDLSNISSVVKGVRIAQGYNNRKDRILVVILSLFGLCENLDDILKTLDNQIFIKFSRKLIKSEEEQNTLLAAMEKYSAIFPIKSLYIPVILRFFYLNGLLDEKLIIKWQETRGGNELSYTGVGDKDIQNAKDNCKLFAHWLKNAEEEN